MPPIAAGLREGASAWPFRWKSAMEDQNRRLHACDEHGANDDRSGWEELTRFFAGHDHLPPPREAAAPAPPAFRPTRSFVSY